VLHDKKNTNPHNNYTPTAKIIAFEIKKNTKKANLHN